jgi:AcrR family transcriptional regulator
VFDMTATSPDAAESGPLRADARRNVELILDAGQRCLARNPDASVGDIAAEAGLGRVTIYGHFKSRPVLVEAIARRALSRANEALERVDLGGDPRDALGRLVDATWEVTRTSGGLVVAADRALPASLVTEAHTGPLTRRVEDLFTAGQVAGAFRDDLPLSWLITTLHALLHNAVHEVESGRLEGERAPELVRQTMLSILEGGVTLRPAREDDVPDLARIWSEGWREAHLGNVPDPLVAARTPDSFRERALDLLRCTTVAVVAGEVAGFVMVEGDEVQQLYVDPRHRGAGTAAALLAEGERQIAAEGHDRAWLAVVAGNVRARRFYERQGWRDEGAFEHEAPGPAGPIPVPAHRYVKGLDQEGAR